MEGRKVESVLQQALFACSPVVPGLWTLGGTIGTGTAARTQRRPGFHCLRPGLLQSEATGRRSRRHHLVRLLFTSTHLVCRGNEFSTARVCQAQDPGPVTNNQDRQPLNDSVASFWSFLNWILPLETNYTEPNFEHIRCSVPSYSVRDSTLADSLTHLL